jgi:hypothetical protein
LIILDEEREVKRTRTEKEKKRMREGDENRREKKGREKECMCNKEIPRREKELEITYFLQVI